MLRGNVIIIRGHSGSGKSTVSAGVMRRLRQGGERICYIDLDYFSWVMPGGDNLGTQEGDASSSSVALSATFTKDHVKKLVNEMLFSAITTALNCDFNVVFEGVLSINRFKDLFERLHAVPNILCHFIYLDVPLSVTLERHKGREKCQTIPESDIIRWRKNERDEKTHYPNELVIQGGASPLDDTVEAIVNHVKKYCLLGSSFAESKKRTNDDCDSKSNSTGINTTKSELPVKLDNDNHSNNDNSNSGGCGDSLNKKARISVSHD
jgi:adenylate kinase family enzyme